MNIFNLLWRHRRAGKGGGLNYFLTCILFSTIGISIVLRYLVPDILSIIEAFCYIKCLPGLVQLALVR